MLETERLGILGPWSGQRETVPRDSGDPRLWQLHYSSQLLGLAGRNYGDDSMTACHAALLRCSNHDLVSGVCVKNVGAVCLELRGVSQIPESYSRLGSRSFSLRSGGFLSKQSQSHL